MPLHPRQLAHLLRAAVASIEDRWFDATHRVHTSGNAAVRNPSEVVGEIRDGEAYVPVRAANARAALAELPIQDLSTFTFIDLGSGKGRMLFLAAELPFKKVLGVEYSTLLHRQALENIATHRRSRQRAGSIESIHADAAQFVFPADPLVLYLFNPFGPEVITRVLANLRQSLLNRPRQVIVLLLWPENSRLFGATDFLDLHSQNRRHHIYVSKPCQAPKAPNSLNPMEINLTDEIPGPCDNRTSSKPGKPGQPPGFSHSFSLSEGPDLGPMF
jgi:SAM-dependent methyltransferase